MSLKWTQAAHKFRLAQLFTDKREKLCASLGHDVSHTSARAPEEKQERANAPAKQQDIALTQQQEQAPRIDMEFAL
jgi:hypothetical protein